MAEFTGLPHLEYDELDSSQVDRVYNRCYAMLAHNIGVVANGMQIMRPDIGLHVLDIEEGELRELMIHEPQATQDLGIQTSDMVRFMVSDMHSDNPASTFVPYFAIIRYPNKNANDFRIAWMINGQTAPQRTEITGDAVSNEDAVAPLMPMELNALDALTRTLFPLSPEV